MLEFKEYEDKVLSSQGVVFVFEKQFYEVLFDNFVLYLNNLIEIVVVLVKLDVLCCFVECVVFFDWY